jgi:uncharacterized repeat protein (TIGR01451 family)
MRKGNIIGLMALILLLGAVAGGLAGAGSATDGKQRPVVRGTPNALATVAATDPCAEFPKSLESLGDGGTTYSTTGSFSSASPAAVAVSPYPGWANPPLGTSSWVSTDAARDETDPTYYQKSFNVSQYTLDYATLTLSGSFLADNNAALSFNSSAGPATTGFASSNFTGPTGTAFTFTSTSNPTLFQLSDFLTFKVGNQTGSVGGLDYSATATCTPLPLPDLSIVKTLTSPTPWQVGGTYTFTTTVTNLGPGSVPVGAVVSVGENMPAGLTYVTASGTGWTCTLAGPGCLSAPLTTALGANSSLPVVTWTVKVAPLSPQLKKLTNCADTSAVLHGAPVPDGGDNHNNVSCVDIPIAPPPPPCTKHKHYLAGKVDNFSLANGPEKATKPIGFGAVSSFDSPHANKGFWHEFRHLNWKRLCTVKLQLRVKPLLSGLSASLSGNDAITLSSGLGASRKSWQQYFAAGPPGPANPVTTTALLSGVWGTPNPGHTFTWTWNASGGLPPGDAAGSDSNGAQLFARLNAPAPHRLDIYVEDDTSVDYIRLTVTYAP